MKHEEFILIKRKVEKAYFRNSKQDVFQMLTENLENMANGKYSVSESMEIASMICYYTIFYIRDGKDILRGSFKDNENGYTCLFGMNTVSQIADWLYTLECGLEKSLARDESRREENIVSVVQEYIKRHSGERITLAETAKKFQVSPSYLSMLFSKYGERKFNDFVNFVKVNEAKKMLKNDPDLKIYEIAELLSYSNGFYFSRVFKKVEGVAPSDYACTQIAG